MFRNSLFDKIKVLNIEQGLESVTANKRHWYDKTWTNKRTTNMGMQQQGRTAIGNKISTQLYFWLIACPNLIGG